MSPGKVCTGRCGNPFAKAADWAIKHPKAIMSAVLAIAALATLSAFIAGGIPLHGAEGRALLAGMVLASQGSLALVYFMKKHDDKVIKAIQDSI